MPDEAIVLLVGLAVTIVTASLVAVLLGKLLPERTHDRIVGLHKMIADERGATLALERKRNDTLDAQNGQLLEQSRTAQALLEAVRDQVARLDVSARRDGGG